MNVSRYSLLGPCCSLMLAVLISSCERTPDEAVQTAPAEIARRTVADYLSIEPDDVKLVSLEAREFGNAALGCSEPGMAYAQVITPGHVAIVEAEGRRFDVRISGSNGRICRKKINGKPGGLKTGKPNVSLMTELARKDLAERLDVPFEQLRQLDIRPFTRSRAPVGCEPECPGEGEACGYLIGIIHDGRRFDYHGIDDRVVACPKILTQ